MEKKTASISQRKETSSSYSTTGLHEKKSSSSVSPRENPDNCDKKVPLDVVKGADIPPAFAQDKLAVEDESEADVATQDEDEELIVLGLQSDDETFEDIVEDVAELKEKETKVLVKSLEKYFSDIESSDDSRGYEAAVGTVDAVKEVSTTKGAAHVERNETKGAALEFEPVESEEEDFEEAISLEDFKAPQPDESLSDVMTTSDVVEDSTGVEGVTTSSTPLFDEEENVQEMDEGVTSGGKVTNKNGEGSLKSRQKDEEAHAHPEQEGMGNNDSVSPLLSEEKSETDLSEKMVIDEQKALSVEKEHEGVDDVNDASNSPILLKEDEFCASDNEIGQNSKATLICVDKTLEESSRKNEEEVSKPMEVDVEISAHAEEETPEKQSVVEVSDQTQEKIVLTDKKVDGKVGLMASNQKDTVEGVGKSSDDDVKSGDILENAPPVKGAMENLKTLKTVEEIRESPPQGKMLSSEIHAETLEVFQTVKESSQEVDEPTTAIETSKKNENDSDETSLDKADEQLHANDNETANETEKSSKGSTKNKKLLKKADEPSKTTEIPTAEEKTVNTAEMCGKNDEESEKSERVASIGGEKFLETVSKFQTVTKQSSENSKGDTGALKTNEDSLKRTEKSEEETGDEPKEHVRVSIEDEESVEAAADSLTTVEEPLKGTAGAEEADKPSHKEENTVKAFDNSSNLLTATDTNAKVSTGDDKLVETGAESPIATKESLEKIETEKSLELSEKAEESATPPDPAEESKEKSEAADESSISKKELLDKADNQIESEKSLSEGTTSESTEKTKQIIEAEKANETLDEEDLSLETSDDPKDKSEDETPSGTTGIPLEESEGNSEKPNEKEAEIPEISMEAEKKPEYEEEAKKTVDPTKKEESSTNKFEIIEIDDDAPGEKKDRDVPTNKRKAISNEEKVAEIDIDPAKKSESPLELSNDSREKAADADKQPSVAEKKAVSDEKPEGTPVAKQVDPEKISKKDEISELENDHSPGDVEMLEIIETTDNEESPNENDKPREEPTIKEDTTMKPAENESTQGASYEEEEPLLVINTSYKEDNYNEDSYMDSGTEQTATSAQTTDSSSEGSLEIFTDKECVNYECKRGSKNFYRAALFTLNYYKISKKRSKSQFVCEECYDRALASFEEMCKTLKQKQPLLHGATFMGQEFVEIIDSSDEDENDCTGERVKDENALPKESIEMLEAELEGAIRKVMHNVEIQNQLSWTKQILQQRLNNLEEDTEFVSEQLRLLQKKADNMHNSLYQCPKIKIRQLTPLDLNSGRSYNPETESTIPPMGEVLRTGIHLNETYYAVKNKAIASWVPCKVIEAIDGYLPHIKHLKHYKIKFLKSKYPMLKTVSAKHMAFFNPPKVRLPIGTRVIAYFDASSLSRGKEKMLIPSAFYPGIIAEPLKQSNKFRYLVFYDDGYFQYVYHKDVRLVCHASENVWEDVHHQSREFIHNYLTQYAVNRPMVQTQKGQSMLVDYNGKWIYARVIDVDCSLVQMLFEGQSRSEWIYRGSTRLGPVYKESNNLVQKNPFGVSRLSRRTEPFIRYINGDDSSSSSQQPQESQQQHQPKPGEVRSVAKKSVSRIDNSQQPVPTVRHLNNSTIFVDDDNKPKGKVVYYTAKRNRPIRPYVSHLCNPGCTFTPSHNLLLYSPLAKPLLSGWERQIFQQKTKKFVVYRGPCGKRLRNMEELHIYLRLTENELNVDNFDFSPDTNCLAEYIIESCIVQKKDISNGKEKMPIPCVNYYDNTMPPDCIYSSQRIPTEGVPLNLDREFLVGCDCEDDCSDKAKCSCWELTYAGAKYGMPNVPHEMVGYQFKRLYEHVPTGIYECNSRCKCKSNCVNRVVQQPLQSKLQVFKTSNRGWGLRCINDVPRGSFICVYAGHLLTEQKANEGGLDAGDEYFAELDYIEVAEQIKEGYESDVADIEEDEDMYNPEKDDDDDEFVAPSELHRNRAFNTRLRARRSTKNSSDAEHDSQERQVISFEPNKTMGQPDNSTDKLSIRKLFGKDEACYVMDAKVTGNLGRYFNHSCSPNLFVQNVFVDTHDLRFPWVAFFAFTHIRAGTELTWNYNYEVGVVPGKVLYCQCGAPNCRQRLL